jgi:predicted DCC family thiol-disulfide oxidoreductase YuxK
LSKHGAPADPATLDPGAPGVTVVYDGDCPLCRAYVRALRLQRAAGTLRLVDARQAPALVRWLAARGKPLEDGLVVQVGPNLYHGANALHALAAMSTPIGGLNRLSYVVFRSPRRAARLYPLLVAGRRLLLRLLGRAPLTVDLRSPGLGVPRETASGGHP